MSSGEAKSGDLLSGRERSDGDAHPGKAQPTLGDLVAPLQPSTFVREHWAPARPFLSATNPELISKLRAVSGLESVEALLSRHRRDVWLFGRAKVPARSAQDFLRAGFNLYITNVESTVPEAKALFIEVAHALQVPPWQIHIEAFAGESGGVSSRHFDSDINFQILLDGTKEWTLEENRHIRNPLLPFQPQRTHDGGPQGFEEEAYAVKTPQPTSFDRERSQRLCATAGTILFLPRGYWHETRSLTRTWGVNVVINGLTWGTAFGLLVADALNQADSEFRAFCNSLSLDDSSAGADGTSPEARFEAAKRVAMEKLAGASLEDVLLSRMGRERYAWTSLARGREVVKRDGAWALLVPDASDEPVTLPTEEAGAAAKKLCAFQGPFSWRHARYSTPEVDGSLLCALLAELVRLGLLASRPRAGDSRGALGADEG
jgi:hypothetical protein